MGIHTFLFLLDSVVLVEMVPILGEHLFTLVCIPI